MEEKKNSMSAVGPNGEKYNITYSEQLQKEIADNLSNLAKIGTTLKRIGISFLIAFFVTALLLTMLYIKLDAMNVLSIIGGV